ncbi:MAG: hypothetical protein AAF907_01660 [Planctomycetota bacterium]
MNDEGTPGSASVDGIGRTVDSPGWRTALTLSWLGQTVASGCWIASVFVYGLSEVGDVLQLAAASAWMIANLAALWEASQ